MSCKKKKQNKLLNKTVKKEAEAPAHIQDNQKKAI